MVGRAALVPVLALEQVLGGVVFTAEDLVQAGDDAVLAATAQVAGRRAERIAVTEVGVPDVAIAVDPISRAMSTEQHDSEIVALLTEHQLAIRLYVQSLLPGDHSAHDVAQQANATLWKKRDDFEVGTNFKAWAFSVARYEVLNHRKKQARESRRLTFSDEMEELIAVELPQRVDDLEERQVALRGEGSFRDDGLHLVGNRLFVTRGFQAALRADRGIGEDEDEEAEPMSVICYELGEAIGSVAGSR